LKIVSDIWKAGANIYLDPSDDRMGITRQNLISTEVMQAAEQHFQEIHTWFQSWKNESVEDITMLKILYQFCGWQQFHSPPCWFISKLVVCSDSFF
ncbi:hypothetical protein ACUOFC_55810, partial [Escherichia sp. TWPC-MK]